MGAALSSAMSSRSWVVGVSRTASLRPGFPLDAANPQQAAFLALQRAFVPSGGLLRDDALVANPPGSGTAVATKSAIEPNAIRFAWNGAVWLPRFQFESGRSTVTASAAQVIAELTSIFDGWELATWFVQPNLWLGCKAPVDLIEHCLHDVLGAARADRFIAAG